MFLYVMKLVSINSLTGFFTYVRNTYIRKYYAVNIYI